MSIFKHVLEDNWIEVEKEVDGYIDQIKTRRINAEKINVLSKLNKMTPDQVSKMMGVGSE